MTASNRSAQFVKLHKVLKKCYKPVEPPPERPVLEHLLFACCLENASYEKAHEAMTALVHTFFDWNEIRVTTIKELAEVMSALPDPAAAANRIKRILQDVFESSYSFELEDLLKKNLGPAVERIQKLGGATHFNVAYLTQMALGGHSIPIDTAAANVLKLLNLMTDKEVEEGSVAGLERAIPKNQGVEFGSLLHQLSTDFQANPYDPALHKILAQVDPTVESRIPKRRPKAAPAPKAAASVVKPKSRAKAVEPQPAEAEPVSPAAAAGEAKAKPAGRGKAAVKAEAAPAAKGEPAEGADRAEKEKAAVKAAKKKGEKAPPVAEKPAAAKVPVAKPVKAEEPAAVAKKPAAKPEERAAVKKPAAKAEEPAPAVKKPVAKSDEPAPGAKKPAVKKAVPEVKRPSVAAGLAKKKPR